MTYSELKDTVVGLAIPQRVARERVPSVSRHVMSGLVDLQTFLPGMKSAHVVKFDGSAYYYSGGMEVPKPDGEVIEVYAEREDVPNADGGIDQQCQCRVDYDAYGLEFLRARCREYSREGGVLLDPDGNYVQMLPQSQGFWAVDPSVGTILAYPAALIPWKLFVRYSAIVRAYDDADEVLDLSEQCIDLLVLWVQHKYEADLRNWQNSQAIGGQYLSARRDEIYRRNNEMIPTIISRAIQNRPSSMFSPPRCGAAYAQA